jgi:DNA-binding NarL/FixJ family response regulator
LADDHALVREGLKHTLSRLADDVEFREAASATEVLDFIEGDEPIDMALLDLVMPGSNGFELLTRVCDGNPELPVVMLSGSVDPVKMRKALDIGAAGYITKSATAEVMLSALRLVLAGGIYVPPDMLKGDGAAPRTPEEAAPTASPPAVSAASLTTRQREVLACLGQGKSNKQIGRELDLSENTVKIHVAAILRALGVDNRTQAAVVARENGIVSVSEDAKGLS